MKKMTKSEAYDFMAAGTRTGKLATVRGDGCPHVAPIWFVLDGEDLIFNTWHASVKGKNLRRDGRIALTVDEEVATYSFVLVEGNVEITADELGRAKSGPLELERVTWGKTRPKLLASATACQVSCWCG